MVIAAYAIGSRHGIVYLRAEYVYLRELSGSASFRTPRRRPARTRFGGLTGFDFDIRIQMGAGAYVCGEESALIESCEGKRGTPRLKPPFPVRVRAISASRPASTTSRPSLPLPGSWRMGADWFRRMGTPESAGTALAQRRRGLQPRRASTRSNGASPCDEVLDDGRRRDRPRCADQRSRRGRWSVGAGRRPTRGSPTKTSPAAVRSSSSMPTATCSMSSGTSRGSSLTSPAASAFPAGQGTVVPARRRLTSSSPAARTRSDLDDMVQWGALVAKTSRCGLGATSANPDPDNAGEVSRDLLRAGLRKQDGSLLSSFDVDAALAGYGKAWTELGDRGTA